MGVMPGSPRRFLPAAGSGSGQAPGFPMQGLARGLAKVLTSVDRGVQKSPMMEAAGAAVGSLRTVTSAYPTAELSVPGDPLFMVGKVVLLSKTRKLSTVVAPETSCQANWREMGWRPTKAGMFFRNSGYLSAPSGTPLLSLSRASGTCVSLGRLSGSGSPFG